jgi:hypothetical protein
LALERTTLEKALLRKENAEYRELLRVRRERRKGKRVAIKGKFVFYYGRVSGYRRYVGIVADRSDTELYTYG